MMFKAAVVSCIIALAGTVSAAPFMKPQVVERYVLDVIPCYRETKPIPSLETFKFCKFGLPSAVARQGLTTDE